QIEYDRPKTTIATGSKAPEMRAFLLGRLLAHDGVAWTARIGATFPIFSGIHAPTPCTLAIHVNSRRLRRPDSGY
ncbi:MAG: hypothetical protein ACKVIW_16880, partial [bacterium]